MNEFQARLAAARAAAFRMVTLLDGMIVAAPDVGSVRAGTDLSEVMDHGSTLAKRLGEASELSRAAIAERLADAAPAEPDHSHDSGEFPRPPVGAA